MTQANSADERTAKARETRISEIAEREKKATKGPWFFASHYDPQIEMLVSAELANDEHENDPVLMHGYTAPDSQIAANWEFVQAAREDIPFLLEALASERSSAIKEAREECARVRERMVTQIRSLLKESVIWWNRDDAKLASANDEKARFLWQFMPNFDVREFDAEFAEIRKAAEAAAIRALGER